MPELPFLSPPRSRLVATLTVLGLALGGAIASHGCRRATDPGSGPAAASSAPVESPTFRLYVVSNVAGALEPCGCTSDQLGGVHHLAALLAKGKGSAGGSLLVSAGPLAFQEPSLEGPRAAQDTWKAEAIAGAFGEMGLAAWTPGANDWAAGAPALVQLAAAARASLVAANLGGDAAGATVGVVQEVANISVGIVGVSRPDPSLFVGKNRPHVTIADPSASLKGAVAEVRARGAKLLIGMAAMARGEALRLVDSVPDLAVLVVGKPSDAGDANDAPSPPQRVGHTLVVQTSNHVQTVGVVDFFVRGGSLDFQDGSGVDQADELQSLSNRITDLEGRIRGWEREGALSSGDLASKKKALADLVARRQRLAEPVVPKDASYLRYSIVEVRPSLGEDPAVSSRMTAYYRRVNEHNRVAFAGRKASPVPVGQSGYAGVERCTTCHAAARNFWNGTPHAKAFSTLSSAFKEYNLDCIGCHVTGYEKPGGSTVTDNDKLRNVQCEACHGPGEAHASAPKRADLIPRAPELGTCVSECHHPPHVDGFDPKDKVRFVLGPGHGAPLP